VTAVKADIAYEENAPSSLPLISVIVPVFNRERLLATCLESIKQQTFKFWECIIVDDGSTDSSLAIAKSFSDKDKRFKAFARTRPNKGAGACRNEGVKCASGAFVVFLDSDDLLSEVCLENRLASFLQHPDCDLVVFRTGGYFETVGDSRTLHNVEKIERDLLRYLRLDVPWPVNGPLWKRSVLQDIGGFDESLPGWQDWQVHVTALLAGKRYVKMRNEPDSYIRMKGDDRIGRRAWTPEHVRPKANFILKLFERYSALLVNDEETRSACAGLAWYLIVRVQELGYLQEAVSHWTRLRRLNYVGFRVWCEGLLALHFHGKPGGRICWSFVARWPRAVVGRVDTSTMYKVSLSEI
jgi:glycosyltransferase involved in cell wall biosynthesis